MRGSGLVRRGGRHGSSARPAGGGARLGAGWTIAGNQPRGGGRLTAHTVGDEEAEMMRRVILAAALALPIAVVAAAPAGACGGLVGENGTIQLGKTTTLAAYTGGVERYITAFEFTGTGESVGSLVPLPDVPTEVTRAG